MAVTDVSGVANAIYSRLSGDAALTALVPDGVHWDTAPQGSAAFVLLTNIPQHDRALVLSSVDGYERLTYDAKAVINSSSVSKANDAAYRIHELLHNAMLDVSGGGYTFMFAERYYVISYAEDVEDSPGARWWHRGGQYQFTVCPAA